MKAWMLAAAFAAGVILGMWVEWAAVRLGAERAWEQVERTLGET